jgi:3-hydroxyacyl-[acyl-carrier-protein] dehydratase
VPVQKPASRSASARCGLDQTALDAALAATIRRNKTMARRASPCHASAQSMRFFLIDKITSWEAGASAEGLKNVALSEDFFDDHFPRRPVMPGVLLLEGMAQLSGLLLEAGLKQKYAAHAKAVLTVLERTKFRAMVKPGDSLRYRTEVLSLNETGGKVKATAWRGETVVAATEMVFAFKYLEDPMMDKKRDHLLKVWMQTPPPHGGEGEEGPPRPVPGR